jgi:hypothetical protein
VRSVHPHSTSIQKPIAAPDLRGRGPTTSGPRTRTARKRERRALRRRRTAPAKRCRCARGAEGGANKKEPPDGGCGSLVLAALRVEATGLRPPVHLVARFIGASADRPKPRPSESFE